MAHLCGQVCRSPWSLGREREEITQVAPVSRQVAPVSRQVELMREAGSGLGLGPCAAHPDPCALALHGVKGSVHRTSGAHWSGTGLLARSREQTALQAPAVF